MSPHRLIIGFALTAFASCGQRGNWEPLPVLDGSPSRVWVADEALPVGDGLDLQTDWLPFELSLRYWPPGSLTEDVIAQYRRDYDVTPDGSEPVVDMVWGDTLVFSTQPLIKSRSGLRRRPDFWWKFERTVFEEYLPYLAFDFNGRPQGCIRLRADARVPARYLHEMIGVMGRERLCGLDQLELLVVSPETDDVMALQIAIASNSNMDFVIPSDWFLDEEEGGVAGESGDRLDQVQDVVQSLRVNDLRYAQKLGFLPIHPRTRTRFAVVHAGMSVDEMRAAALTEEAPAEGLVLCTWNEPDLAGVTVQDWVDTWRHAQSLAKRGRVIAAW